MQKRKNSNLILYGAITLIILFIIAIFVLFSFTRENEEKVTELYSSNMGLTVELYTERADSLFESASVSADTAASLLETYIVGENAWTKEALDSIVDSSSAYGVIYYRNDGIIVTSTGLDVPDVSGYKNKVKGTKRFFHVEDDGINGTPAFVYSVPVKKGNSYRGYLLTYISDEDIGEVFSESPYGTDYFCSIVDDSGNVQFMLDETDGTGYFEGGLWGNVQTYAVANSQWIRFNSAKVKKTYSYINVDKNGERRPLYISPIADTTWIMITGIETETIENKGITLWKENNKYQNIMYMIFAGIIITIVTMAVIIKVGTAKRMSELENKADTDLLTGLSNKIAAERQIREYIAENPGTKAVMIVMDIDNFKKINDTMGHSFGDEVIRQVGHQLRSMFRISDVVGRMGGDEFVILLKNIKDRSVIEKECRKLEDCFHHFEVGEYVKYSVTASLGAAVFPENAQSYEKLYKAADAALYTAKRRGKNQLAFYDSESIAEKENK